MKTAEALTRKFVDAVQKQQAAIDEGTTAPRQASRYIEAAEELMKSEEGESAFVELLRHEDVNVRVMAGSFLIDRRSREVLPVLRAAAKGKGMAAVGAEMTLARHAAKTPQS